jgi:hypothetical protein
MGMTIMQNQGAKAEWTGGVDGLGILTYPASNVGARFTNLHRFSDWKVLEEFDSAPAKIGQSYTLSIVRVLEDENQNIERILTEVKRLMEGQAEYQIVCKVKLVKGQLSAREFDSIAEKAMKASKAAFVAEGIVAKIVLVAKLVR